MLAESEIDVRFIAGNHEEVFVMAASGDAKATKFFTKIGGRETILSYPILPEEYGVLDHKQLAERLLTLIPRDHVDFVAGFEDMVTIGDYLFVHAGIQPGRALDEQRGEHLRWIRDEFLDDERDHGKVVVHGHTICEDVEIFDNRIGIDTGAYCNGRLTAIGLEGDEPLVPRRDRRRAPRMAQRRRPRLSDQRLQPGRSIRATNPPSGAFSSTSRPPSCSTIVRAMARPRPAPPVSRLRELSSRANGSTSSAIRSAGMPGPSSVTTIATLSPIVSTESRARVPYLSALSTRLRIARASRSRRTTAIVAALSRKVDVAIHVAIILRKRIGERGKIGRGGLFERAAGARQRENVVEHRGDRFDAVDHPLAQRIVGDAFDADAHRRERGAQIVADRAEHPVLVGEHRRDPVAHRVEPGNEIADVAGPARRDGFGTGEANRIHPSRATIA